MPAKLHAAAHAAARAAGVVLASIMAGYLLLVAVHCLPTARMTAHVRQSLPLLQAEGQYPQMAPGYRISYRDNFTDIVMLKTAIYDGPESPLAKAAGSYLYWGDADLGQLGSLTAQLEQGAAWPRYSYARHWTGYLVALKPLLLLFDLGELRLLNAALQLLLLALVSALAMRCRRGWLVPPLVLAYILLMPAALQACLFYANVCVTAYGALLLLMPLLERQRPGAVALVFTFVGCLTSYSDLISYPLFTLGLPLAVCLAWRPLGWRAGLGQTVCLGLHWCAGYLGMWAGKWLLADLITGGGLASALETIRLRTSSATQAGESFGALEPLLRNVKGFCTPFYLVLLAAATLAYLALAARRRRPLRRALPLATVLLLVAALPFAWYLVVKNHSLEHDFYTCRALVIPCFAWLCLLARWAAAGPTAPDTEEGDGTNAV